MKTLILDDELYCTDVLSILIQKHCPSLEVVAVYNDPVLALEYLSHHPVDVVFLDIEMPVLNGFELLRKLPNMQSRVIFTTAYNQYALKAFRFNAIDYLLKPIDKTELMEAVGKLPELPLLSPPMLQYLSEWQKGQAPKKILLPIGQEIHFVNVDQIICCEADGSYCKVYCEGQAKPYMLSKNLKDIEEMVQQPHFIRPHASWLINSHFIEKVVKGEGMEVVLSNQLHIPVARSKKQEILKWLGIN
ncbi:MAG TPA: LytTR family DNA-binding domain-containing protein [Saprospiraceae bacterium]|nr:LytTR family DNA-binding domain-containing protein [Saprospiraceae bacterium]